MKFSRKAQAAMEFLSTYGWAFMILLVMIGAMSYFGVTEVSTFIPERCQFASDALCQDFQIVSLESSNLGIVMISLSQTTGRSMYLQDFSCEDLEIGAASTGYYLDGTVDPTNTANPFLPGLADLDLEEWKTSENVLIKCSLSPNPFAGRGGDKVRVPFELTVQKRQSGFNHLLEGDVIATITEVNS